MYSLHTLLFAIMPMLQSSQPALRGMDDLAERVVDGSYGFSIRPPRGWCLDRRQIPQGRETTILRMMEPTGRTDVHEILLKHKTIGKPVPIGRMLRLRGYELDLEHPTVEIESQQVQPIADRPGACLAGHYTAEGMPRARFEAIVEITPRSYLVLTCDVPVSIRDRMESLFRRVTASLKFLADPSGEKAMTKALEAGAAWLATCSPDTLKKSLVKDRRFQITSKGKPIGRLRVTERAGRRNRRDGIEINEERWIFEDAGIVRRVQSRMFVSLDLTFERWQSSVTRWIPAEVDRAERLENAFEEGLRERNILVTGQAPTLGQPTRECPPIEVPKAYLSRAMIRMLPRLLGTPRQPRRIGFFTFDADRAGLIVQLFKLRGECEPPANVRVKAGKACCIEQCEGLATSSSIDYVDESGEVLLTRAGDWTLQPATPASLERTFAGRVREARQAMARLEYRYHEDRARFLRPPSEPRP